MPLDLVVPDLLSPADASAALREIRLPALEKWLARADIETTADAGMTGWLARAFELPLPAPIAPICLAGEGEARPGAWMRADPVHLRIERDHLALHDAAMLDVTRAEADALVAALQAHFGRDGLEFHAAAPERWYVRVPEAELPATTPLEGALGRDVFGLLPRSKGAFNWRSALTEAQMVLGAHAVNAARDARGQPAINSVWLWGEGIAPSQVKKVYALVYADDIFARGLGALSGAQPRPLPRAIGDVAGLRADESALVVLDRLTAGLRRGDESSWRKAAEDLDAGWFEELGAAIARFGRVRVVLPAQEGIRVATLTSASRWRWYRPRRPLAAHA